MTQAAKEDQPNNTAIWLNRLRTAELPVMSQVMKDLNALLNNPQSSAREVAGVIKRDASLTARVLKVANSVIHLGSSRETVSLIQAVVKLGVRGIKSLCISVILLESLLNRPHIQSRLTFCLTRAFHAAVQAGNLHRQDDNVSFDEEIFIAALLLHLGEMLFWSCPQPEVVLMGKRMEEEGLDISEVAAQLDVDFNALSLSVAEEWQLGGVVLKAMSHADESDVKVKAVLLGDQVSEALMQGWQSPAFRHAVSKVAAMRDISEQEAFDVIRQGADQAAKMAGFFAADEICSLMQAQKAAIEGFLVGSSAQGEGDDSVQEDPDKDASDQAKQEGQASAEHAMQPDLQQQMVVLDRLWLMIERQSDVNGIFNMMVDGMHHSIGMERVAIAITNPMRSNIVAKYIRGDGCDHWRKEFSFSVSQPEDNILAYCIHKNEPIWVCEDYTPSLMHLLTSEIQKVIGDVREFVAAPVYSKDKPIALLYADRAKSGANIDESQFQSFCRFAQQASAGLNILAA